MDTERWANFFIAEVGAAAALSGLLFVAISINLARVIELPHIANRAAASLAMLVAALIICSIGLVPDQPAWLVGGEYFVVGFVAWLFPTVITLRGQGSYRPERVWKAVAPPLLGQVATLPYMIAGVLVMAGHGEGLYWLAPGVILCFLAAAFNAWVLLVEIMR
jgi:hypothetical protein